MQHKLVVFAIIFAGIGGRVQPMKANFSDTSIAFAARSDKELKNARRLFRLIGNPTITRIGRVLTMFALKLRLPIKGIIKRTIFRQFCGGETVEECTPVIEQLEKHNVGTILDYSVEGQENARDFEITTQKIIKTLDKAHANRAIPFAVFKVTGISRFSLLEKVNDRNAELTEKERKEYADVVKRIDTICKHAHSTGTPVFIDAEDSWVQDAIDHIVHSMMVRYNREKAIVFNTLQLYRHDRLEFLKRSIEDARMNGYYYGAKLVRGAYMEKERERAREMGYQDPIQPDKASTDRDFNESLSVCLENIDIVSLCAGTHNEESCEILADLMHEKGIANNDKRVWFAQLLGMSDHISFNLADQDYNVAKYVPFGPVRHVMPYLLRRAEENTSVAGQMGRELRLINEEVARRKNR